MLWTSDKAAVAPTVALSLFALLGVGGIAFDYARLAAMDTELQNAADQAALAAATQLDGTADAATRAVAAAQSLLSNQTRFANDGGTMTVATGQDITTRNAAGAIVSSGTRVTFYTTKAHAESDTNGFAVTAANAGTLAKFVKIDVTGRTANYVLTPVVEAISSGVST
jgi:Flp pilus assembly protein TadG